MNKVRSGEPLRIRAADWNRIVDTVHASRDRARLQGAAPIAGSVPTNIVDVLNAGKETIRGFNVIGLAANNAIDTGEPETNHPTRNIYFTATEASEDTNCILAITQENIEPGEIGKALVSGVTLAQFLDAYNDEDESCTFADVNPASSRCLRRVPGGRIRLLTPKVNVAVSGLALVLLGATASSGGGASPEQEAAPEPWRVSFRDGTWQVYSPSIRIIAAPSAPGLWTSPALTPFYGADGWTPFATFNLGEPSAGKCLNVAYDPLIINAQEATKITLDDAPIGPTINAFCVGQFYSASSGLAFRQDRVGAAVFDASKASPPYVANVTTYGAESSQDIIASARSCFVGRTHWMAALSVGAEQVATGALVDSETGQPVIASPGVEMVLRTAVVHESSTMATIGSALFPVAKIAAAETLATIEQQARVESVGVDTPSDNNEQGRLYGASRSSGVWVATASTPAVETDLLYTEVEAANEATAYSGIDELTE